MEIIDNNYKPTSRRKTKSHGYVFAGVLIIIGLVFLGRNLGYIDSQVTRILISWQMLLIVIGISSLVKRNFASGAVLIGIGTFFLLPFMMDVSFHFWFRKYWPVGLVLIGILLIIKRNKRCDKSNPNRCEYEEKVSYHSEDGFLNSDNRFGGVRHIVLDPIFKGAAIKNRFGGTAIDLRRTNLQANETYIDIDCTFGGIEIYVPYNWLVISDIRSSFGGWKDKRFQSSEEIDNLHKLIIRGNLTFSGIEIKN